VRQSIRLGTYFGVSVGLNWSVLLICALFAWELAEYQFPAHAGHASAADWVAGIASAVVLLLSVLAHEISHSVVARRNGVKVRSVTLFVLGGVAQLEGEAHTAGADFRIAAVGPATSVVVAGVFGAAQAAAVAAGGHGLTVATLSWLWEINLMLAGFNLIPAAPLDGGRILRAGLWRHWGDRLRATAAAARIGRGFAAFLIGAGFLASLYVGFTGLWAALIGVFLYSGARAEEQLALVESALRDVTVGEVMTPNPPSLPGRITLAELSSHLWQYRGDAIAVTDESGWLSGVVTLEAVRAVPADQRRTTMLTEIAIPLDATPVARPEEPMAALLERMAARGGHPALVLDADSHLAGIVALTDVQRAATIGAGR
jgi:Zn-dependent protease